MGRSKPQRTSAEERIRIICKWSHWFYDRTKSYAHEMAGDLGMELAYLWAAIAEDSHYLVHNTKECEVLAILAGFRVPRSEDIWKYIRAEGNKPLLFDYEDFPNLIEEVEKRR